MPEHEWGALGPHSPDPDTGRRRPSNENHPQFQLKVLLDRMGVARAEVEIGAGVAGGTLRRRGAGRSPMQWLRRVTAKWQGLAPGDRRLTGVRAVELADPAEEAQADGPRSAGGAGGARPDRRLVTPDRNLARRVSAHLRRWGIEADDSAGRPLSRPRRAPCCSLWRVPPPSVSRRFLCSLCSSIRW